MQTQGVRKASFTFYSFISNLGIFILRGRFANKILDILDQRVHPENKKFEIHEKIVYACCVLFDSCIFVAKFHHAPAGVNL